MKPHTVSVENTTRTKDERWNLMTKLSLEEQETIINFNRADTIAEVYTHEPRLLRRLRVLTEQYPDTFRLTGKHFDCGYSYELPKELISIRAPMSDETRQAYRERAMQKGFTPPQKQGARSQNDIGQQ